MPRKFNNLSNAQLNLFCVGQVAVPNIVYTTDNFCHRQPPQSFEEFNI